MDCTALTPQQRFKLNHPDRVREHQRRFNQSAKRKAYIKNWRRLNTEKTRIYKARYKAAHPERWKESDRKQKSKNLIRNRERALRYYHDNRECRAAYTARYRRENRKRYSGFNMRWLKSHPEKRSHYDNIRRARKLACQSSNTKVIQAWESRWRNAKSITCYWCLGVFNPSDCHLDHMVPLSGGGTHQIENLCVACSHCNQTKHSFNLDVWNKKLKQPCLKL